MREPKHGTFVRVKVAWSMLKLCIYMHRPQGLEGKLPRHCDWQSILGGFGHDLFKSDVSSAQGSQVRTDTLRQTLHWVPQPMPKPMGCAREIRSPGGREAWAKQLKLAKESILILSFVSFVQLSLPIPNKMGWNTHHFLTTHEWKIRSCSPQQAAYHELLGSRQLQEANASHCQHRCCQGLWVELALGDLGGTARGILVSCGSQLVDVVYIYNIIYIYIIYIIYI